MAPSPPLVLPDSASPSNPPPRPSSGIFGAGQSQVGAGGGQMSPGWLGSHPACCPLAAVPAEWLTLRSCAQRGPHCHSTQRITAAGKLVPPTASLDCWVLTSPTPGRQSGCRAPTTKGGRRASPAQAPSLRIARARRPRRAAEPLAPSEPWVPAPGNGDQGAAGVRREHEQDPEGTATGTPSPHSLAETSEGNRS